MNELIIKDKNSDRVFRLTPVYSNALDIYNLSLVKEKYPFLADSIIAFGGSCIAFYAIDENGHRFLVKRFTKSLNGQESSKIIKEIVAEHDKASTNYFLDDYFIGSDSEADYQIFARVNGHTVESICPNSITSFLEAITEFRSFLESLKLIHDINVVHFDIKPQNIFVFKANECDKNSMQILDFGSAIKKDMLINAVKTDGKQGYHCSSTLKWYKKEDIEKLCIAIQNGEEGLEYTLDLTSAVRVLCYIMCNRSDGFNFSNTKIEQYEGICNKLNEIYLKATEDKLSNRYLSCDQLIGDIDIIIEAISGVDNYPEALKLVSKNTRLSSEQVVICEDKLIRDLKIEYANEFAREEYIQIDDLLCQINTDILPYIKIQDTAYSSIALEQIISTYTENILLLGTGGGGKSTALSYLYLSALNDSNNIYLYLSAKDLELERLYNDENKIIALLNLRYSKCNIKKLLLNPKIKAYILFDALDEVHENVYARILKEIDELSKYNNQFIITSREVAKRQISLSNIIQGEILPLTEGQIEKAISSVDEIRNYPIYKLLQTPMLLTIFKKLQLSNDYKKMIKYPEELIEGYLKEIYCGNNKKGAEELFEKFLIDTASYSVTPLIKSTKKQHNEALAFFKSQHVEHLISSKRHYDAYYRAFNGEGYKIVFAHKLYEDYFKGRWLYDFFSKTVKKKYLEITDFYFEKMADIQEDFSPYWIDKLKAVLLEYFDSDSIYSALNHFLSCFEKKDIKRKIRQSGFKSKRFSAMENILQMVVLCCDGELVDVAKNKPLINLGAFYRHFDDVVNYDTVKSYYIPWYVNIHFLMGTMDAGNEISANDKLEKKDDEDEKKLRLNRRLWAKKLVVSKWNLSCKSRDGSIYNKLGTRLIYASTANSDNDTFVIPKGVFSIEDDAFQYCVCREIKAKSIFFYSKDGILYRRFPKALIKYPSAKSDEGFKLKEAKRACPYAFAGAEHLKSLDLSGVRQLGVKKALLEGASVESVILPKGILYIGEGAFLGCERLKTIELPDSLRQIKSKAFLGCHKLTSVKFPEKLRRIEWCAFEDCESLESFIAPKGLRHIGLSAFAKTHNLKAVSIGEGVRRIERYAFFESGVEDQVQTRNDKEF